MSEIASVIERIEAYCSAKKLPETTFGRLAVNDGKLLKRLRKGGTITLETLKSIDAAIQSDVGAGRVRRAS